MGMMTMRFYITRTSDGSVHVQNVAMGMMGQHHIHSAKGFERWVKDTKVPKDDIIELGTECDCGLKPGQTKSGDTVNNDMKQEWR